jgi:enediyne biosynthesis protein E4
MTLSSRLILSLLFAGAAVPARSAPADSVQVPDPDIGADSLAARAKAQRETIGQFKVFYEFQFQDRLKESGITFVHRIVNDAGRTQKAVHYDHGNGIAVADVDGDGRPDIYLLTQIGGNELWRNLGGGRFENITEPGIALAGRISVTASFADIDNDGDQDLFVTTVGGGNALFENDGHGHFKDISKSAGVDFVGHSSGAVFFDYDNDGLLDLYLCNVGRYTTDKRGPDGALVGLPDAFAGQLHPDRTETAILYKNMGGNKFRDVTDEVGLGNAGWSGDASFADLNGDGFPDLYVLNMQGDSHYYENVGGHKFVDKTAQYFPKTPWGSMGIKFFDYDNDGRSDLFITDMHSDMSEEVGPEREKLKSRMQFPPSFLHDGSHSIFGNAFYHNLGNGKFEEISDRLGLENYWPWGVSVGDLNADGWQDVFITASMNHPFRYGINSLLLNNRGERFLDSEFLLGVEPRRDGRTHTPWFDVDCASADADPKVCGTRTTGTVTVMASLGSRSSVMFDLDDDGDLDIVTNEFNSAPQVLISNLAERRRIHWLKVELVGKASNRNGLGATVRVVTKDRTLTQWNDGKSGYLSQSVLPLYFGLGDATKIDRVEVDWPSGRKQIATQQLRANTLLRLVEPDR